ncbi:hypothetical protein V5F41_22500 [Xanthobacter autotrophicus]|uniref:hypothetical protein n=1 Tax=Xanthobacter autotrophicus TaxID=280 RepID=UPI003728E058
MSDDGEIYRQWIKLGLQKPGKNASGLAKVLGRNPSAVTRMVNGERQVKANELPLISSYLGEPVPIVGKMAATEAPDVARVTASVRNATAVRVAGEVAAGTWLEILDDFDPSDATGDWPVSPIPADPRYPALAQFDLKVRGTSINRYAREGEILRCVDLHRSDMDFHDGDLVIVRRKRLDLIETTAKRVRFSGGKLELWPESDDPHWQTPVVLAGGNEDDVIEVTAVVIFKYAPAR